MERINKDYDQQVLAIKSRLINTMMLLILIFMVPGIITGNFISNQTGIQLSTVLMSFGFVLVSALCIFHKKILFQVRLWCLITFLLTYGILRLFYYGYMEESIWWLGIVSIISYLFLKKTKAVLIISLNIIIVVVYIIMYLKGHVSYHSDLFTNFHSPFSLIYTILCIVLVVSAIILSYNYLYTLLELKQNKLTEEIETRKTIEQLMRERENYFKTLFNSAEDAVFIVQNYRFIEFNDKAIKLFGMPRESLINKTPWDISPPSQFDGKDSKKEAENYINKVLNGESQLFEWLHQKKDGTLLNIEINLSLIDAEKQLFLATMRDITEKKRIQNALKESEKNHKTAQKIAKIGHWFFDINKNKLQWSDEVYRIFGLHPQEFGATYEAFLSFVYPEDRDMVNKSFNDSLQKKQPYEIIHRLLLKTGDIKYVSEKCNMELDDVGKPLRTFGTVQDITSLKKTELALLESQEKLKNIFDSSTDGFVVSDLQQNIITVNKRILEFTGMEEKEICKKKLLDFVPPELLSLISNRLNLIYSGENLTSVEIKIKNMTGGYYVPVELNSKLIPYENNKALLTVLHDITERRQMQRKLYKAQIESEEKERERYAKELHDGLGPILSTCKIYFHAIKDQNNKIKRLEHLQRAGELIEDALYSIKEISNNLSPHILRNYGLRQALLSFIDKLKNISQINFVIETNLKERFSEVIEFTLYRSLIELINNSVKYSGATEIKISIRHEDKFLTIIYSDNGKGFDYQNTISKGKGFGLLNLENRIKKIEGEYDYYSSPGQGIKVKIIINLND